MSRKIAVIGSNSFSGADFIDLLLEDPHNEVIGLSRSVEKDELFLAYHRHQKAPYHFYQFDLNQDVERINKLFDSFCPEYIVNFAAQSEVEPSWSAPWDWMETNTVSLTHLIDHLKDVKYLKRYVHISSPEIYGSCRGKVKEDAPLNPSTPYAASKAAADMLLLTYVKNFNFPVVMVRSTNVYGARQQLFKIIPKTIIAVKSGSILELDGGGEAIKSYIHIRDVSRGELQAMLYGQKRQVYHFSPDEGIAVKDLVKMVCELMGASFREVVRDVEDRLGQDSVYSIDSSKAREEFHWRPTIPLSEGIPEVIDWVNTNWKRIQQVPHTYIHKF